MTPAVPGHAEPAAAPGLAVEEEPEPITATVGPADANVTVWMVVGAVIATAALVLALRMLRGQQSWCSEDPDIEGGITGCIPVTDTMKTVVTWVGTGVVVLVWVIVAITVLRNLTREQPPASENRIDEGEQP
jgi:hypothetical protein